MVKHDPTPEEFEELVKTGRTIVDFWASWCGPCRAQAPVVEQLEADGVCDLIKIDVDEPNPLVDKFGIVSIPTLVLYDGGRIVKQFVGLTPPDVLKAAFGV